MKKFIKIILITLSPLLLIIVLSVLISLKHVLVEKSFDSDVQRVFKQFKVNIKNKNIRFGNLVGNGNKCVVALMYEVSRQDVDLPSLLNKLETENLYPWNSILANAYVYKYVDNQYFEYKDESWDKIGYINHDEISYPSDDILRLYLDLGLQNLNNNSYLIIALDFTDTEIDTLNLTCN